MRGSLFGRSAGASVTPDSDSGLEGRTWTIDVDERAMSIDCKRLRLRECVRERCMMIMSVRTRKGQRRTYTTTDP